MGDKKLTSEEIVEGFQRLRQQQRAIATKIAELETDKVEHTLAIDALNEVEKSRRCYRLIGGVLTERTVSEVLPALNKNKSFIASTIGELNTQMLAKGDELNSYRLKHKITVRGENNGGQGDNAKGVTDAKPNQSAGVLVPSSQ